MFTPTYLYIKQHSVTKKCYFGKTTQQPVAYRGSGKHWKSHVRKHGREFVETIWFHLFETEEELTRNALAFSRQQDIVNSSKWLNLKPENGLDGGMIGKHSPEAIEKMRIASTGVRPSAETIELRSAKLRGVPRSEEVRAKISETKKGHVVPDETRLKMSLAAKKIPPLVRSRITASMLIGRHGLANKRGM